MVQKMKSSGCLYGLSGQGVHILYQSQLLPAFLAVCNAVRVRKKILQSGTEGSYWLSKNLSNKQVLLHYFFIYSPDFCEKNGKILITHLHVKLLTDMKWILFYFFKSKATVLKCIFYNTLIASMTFLAFDKKLNITTKMNGFFLCF